MESIVFPWDLHFKKLISHLSGEIHSKQIKLFYYPIGNGLSIETYGFEIYAALRNCILGRCKVCNLDTRTIIRHSAISI